VASLCVIAALGAADADDGARARELTASGVLRLLTGPDGYRKGGGFGLARRGEARYDLWTLGDDASGVLVDALHSDQRIVRLDAVGLLNDFADESVREPLRRALLAEQHESVRHMMDDAMGRLFPGAMADILVESLSHTAAKDIYDDRVQRLLGYQEARALPRVWRFVATEGAPDAAAAFAALCLVEAGDRDAVPLLMQACEAVPPKALIGKWGYARVISALVAIDDERVGEVLATALRSTNDAVTMTNLPHVLGARLVPYLLGGDLHADRARPTNLNAALTAIHRGGGPTRWDGVPPSIEHVHLYGAALLDAGATIERYSADNADARLRRALADILASLGPEGRAYLRQGVLQPHSHREALQALASYHDRAALRDIAGLASDRGYPHRAAALRALAEISEALPEEAEPYWLVLARDKTIDAAVHYGNYVSRVDANPSPRAQALLTTLLAASDPEVQRKVPLPRSRPRGAITADMPEGLEIRISTDRLSYAYNAPATMAVELVNSGAKPILLYKRLFDSAEDMSKYLSIDLVMPDGDRRTYIEHARSPDWVIGPSHTHRSGPGGYVRLDLAQTLEPGDRVSAEIDLRKHCRPAQPGAYRAQLIYGRPEHDRRLREAMAGGPLPVVRSNWVEFVVQPPPDEQVDRLVSRLDVDTLTSKDSARVVRICYMLGELRDPRAIDALVAVAGLRKQRRVLRRKQHMAGHALMALAKFDTPEVVPVWVGMLDGRHDLPAEQLGKLGDRRAIAPLRRRALNDGHMAAARALAELGDDNVIRFLRWDALNGMDANDESTWSGAKAPALALMLRGEVLADRLRHKHPAVRKRAVSIASQEGRVDVLAMALADADARVRLHAVDALAGQDLPLNDDTGSRAICVDALNQALADAEPDIRRAAARGLARLGDASVEALLRENLTVRDYKTRVEARAALNQLRRSL